MSVAQKQFSRHRLPLYAYMRKRRNWQPFVAILITVILVTAGFMYYSAGRHHARSSMLPAGQQYATYQCPYGERKMFTLADSTMVLLNSRTHLYVPVNFPHSSREVILDGEAFFGVRKPGNKEFVITTDKLRARTKGGFCRIRSLESQSGATFYLLNGAASVQKSYHSNTDNQPEQLQSGEMILANKDIDLMEKETFPPAEQQDCLDGKLVFNNTPVSTAFKKIEDWFGVQMELRGKNTPSQGISGVFHTGSLQNMLSLLSDSIGFTYRITRDKVVIRF